jgi:hypothetical protein
VSIHDHTALVLGDVIRASLDDNRIHLPPRAQRRPIERAAELLAIASYELVGPTMHSSSDTGCGCNSLIAARPGGGGGW